MYPPPPPQFSDPPPLESKLRVEDSLPGFILKFQRPRSGSTLAAVAAATIVALTAVTVAFSVWPFGNRAPSGAHGAKAARKAALTDAENRKGEETPSAHGNAKLDDRAARKIASRKVGRHSRSTTGLLNQGNNCFANSSLQVLAASPVLYRYLCGLQQFANTSAKPLFSLALLELITALNQPLPPGARRSLSPEPIIGVLEHVHRARLSRRQNDAHEMLHLLLETLEAEMSQLKKVSPGNPSLTLPFQGSVVDTIRCSTCKTESSRGETAFLVQSLLVPVSSARQCYVEDLLSHAVQGVNERIDGYNCTKCRLQAALAPPEVQRAAGLRPTTDDVRQCLKPYENRPRELPSVLESLLPTVPGGAAEKLTVLGRAPALLILHLSRSVYGAFGARRNACRVVYPDFLSVRAYAENRDNSGSDKPFERTARYRLHAVIRHAGTHASGHYEASRRSSPFWETQPEVPGTMPPFWTISDASVTPATLSRTLDAGSNAYILLYEAID